MSSEEREVLVALACECINADTASALGPVVIDVSPELPGIWLQVVGQFGFLGCSAKSATLTAELSDWWIPSRDGDMTEDDLAWFECRVRFRGELENYETIQFRQERRLRNYLNRSLVSDGELPEYPESGWWI